MNGFFGQLPYKCRLEEVASVGDWLKNFPQLDSRVATLPTQLSSRAGEDETVPAEGLERARPPRESSLLTTYWSEST